MYSVCLSSGSICALSTVEVGHFCRFGAENGQIWPLETGYGRNPPTNRCSVFTGDYGRDVWPLVDPLTPHICDIPSRRLLSAVLYGETPLGADRAEEVRLTAKRKPWYCAPHPARPGGPKGMGQFALVLKCRVANDRGGGGFQLSIPGCRV